MKLRLLAVVPFFLLVTSCTTENIFHAPAPIIYPVDSSAILIQRFYAEYQPNIFLAGILISDSVAGPQYVLETGTAFKAAGRYYTNAHVALVLHKLAGAFMPDWVERPVYSAKLVLIPSGKSVRETFLLDGFSLHPEYDTTLECADLAQLYLKSVPADTLGLPIASANETDALEAGQEIWTMGFPGETQYESYVYPRATLKRGYISALRSIAAPYSPSLPNQLIQHDMDLTGGTSGSPVFSISGTVIGVNFSGNDQGSVNFAVRSDLLFTDTSMNQRFADVDTFRSHYLIVEGKSIGEVALGDTVNRLLPAFSSADDTAAFFTDSLTYLIQCRIANDTIRAMRLYKYDYDLLPSPFSTDRFLGIGSYMETVSALYTPSLLWVDRVDRGLDTVDVTVVQSKGIAFVRDRYRGTIAEVFIFKAGDSLDFSKFTYKKKFLAKQRMPSGGVRPIRVPGLFFR